MEETAADSQERLGHSLRPQHGGGQALHGSHQAGPLQRPPASPIIGFIGCLHIVNRLYDFGGDPFMLLIFAVGVTAMWLRIRRWYLIMLR
jgi:hypothetical protein